MENTNKGGIIIPDVMTEKNKILSRAMTFLSEEEGIGHEIFNELATLMDDAKEPVKELTWDTALTDGIEATEASIKPYSLFLLYMQSHFTIQRK